MPWFPSTRDSSQGWRFDIVGLLAVIGESTIAEHVQEITASKYSWIPRLIPAPQALLKNVRPNRLPSIPGIELVGVKSGTSVHELNYFANAIHDVKSLQDYEFREVRITYADESAGTKNATAKASETPTADHKNSTIVQLDDLESGGHQKSPSATPPTNRTITISMRDFCPLNILLFISTLMAIGLFIWAALIHDGVCCVAIVSISVSTSLACQSSQWKPQLKQRPTNAEVPPGDMVIQTRGAAFVVVHCDENITRELYTGTERCEYVNGEKAWSFLVATSTILLMISVVLLGNCEWTMQAATGAGYIILNGLYWGLPLIFNERHSQWDMSCYKVEQIHPALGEKSKSLKKDEHGNLPSFTRTLAYAIHATKANNWVKVAGVAPKSKSWDEWVDMALANQHNPAWDSVAAKDELMRRQIAAEEAASAAQQPQDPGLPTAADAQQPRNDANSSNGTAV